MDPFVAALVGTVALATLLPVRGVAAAGLSKVVVFAIGWLFFLYGVRLPTREALAAVRDWRLQVAVLLATYAAFPAVGLASSLLAPRLISPELGEGLLFLGLLPSTVQSSIAFTAVAGGNVAGAVCAASLSNLMGVFFTPLLVGALLGGTVGFDASSVAAIAGQIVAPFFAGQLSRRWLLRWLERYEHLLGRTDRAAILLVVYVAFARGVSEGIWSQIAWPDLLILLAICSLVLVAMLLLTGGAGRLLGLHRGDRIALLMCGSKKSLASGLPMATILLPSASVGLLVLPLMLYHQLQLIVCALIAQRMGRSEDGTGRRKHDREGARSGE